MKILYILLAIFLLQSCQPKNQDLFNLEVNDKLIEKIVDLDLIIFQDEFEDLVEQDPSKFRLIDFGTLAEYNKNGLKGAIHIPMIALLDEGNINMFQGDSLVNVLYSSGEVASNLPALILQLLDLGNFKILLEEPEAVFTYGSDDVALYDYASVWNELTKNKKLDAPEAIFEPIAAPKRIVVKKKKPVEEEEEGC